GLIRSRHFRENGAPSPLQRGGRLSRRRGERAERLLRALEDELAEDAELVIGAVIEAADRSIPGRDEAVLRPVTLVDERNVDRSDRLIIDTEVEIMILERRVEISARLHPVVAAKHGGFRRE